MDQFSDRNRYPAISNLYQSTIDYVLSTTKIEVDNFLLVKIWS